MSITEQGYVVPFPRKRIMEIDKSLRRNFQIAHNLERYSLRRALSCCEVGGRVDLVSGSLEREGCPEVEGGQKGPGRKEDKLINTLLSL